MILKGMTLSFASMFLRPLFATVFIGVNYDSTTCSVSVQKRRGGSVVDDKNTDFKILNYELSMDAIKFIKRVKNKYSFSYLATISKSNNQILVPSLQRNDYAKFGISNEKDYRTIKIMNSTIFIRKDDLDEYMQTFKKMLGLDYLFSPFALLYVIAKPNFGDSISLYVLQERENLCVFVATKKGILYGNFLIINPGATQEPVQKAEDANTIKEQTKKLEDSLDLGDDFDDLAELQDLDDDLDDLDNFDFDFKETEVAGVSSLDDMQDLGRSTQILNTLQKALKDFYRNQIYDSQFVENVYIYDCYGMSMQAMDNIKTNLMIDTDIKKINLSDEIVKLSAIELDG